MAARLHTDKHGRTGWRCEGQVDGSCHEKVEFGILKKGIKAKSRIITQGFRRADFRVFRDLLRVNSWHTALERRGVQDIWVKFKDHLLQTQEWFIPMRRKSSKGGRGLHV